MIADFSFSLVVQFLFLIQVSYMVFQIYFYTFAFIHVSELFSEYGAFHNP